MRSWENGKVKNKKTFYKGSGKCGEQKCDGVWTTPRVTLFFVCHCHSYALPYYTMQTGRGFTSVDSATVSLQSTDGVTAVLVCNDLYVSVCALCVLHLIN